MKKTLLALTSLGVIATPVVAVVSCSATTQKSYDLGLAAPAINSLNYIKYKNTATVVPSMVEGLFKAASSDKNMQTLLNFPELSLKWADGSETTAGLAGSSMPLATYGYLPGSTVSSSNGMPIVGLNATKGDPSNFSQISFSLTSKHKWTTWRDKNGNQRQDNVSPTNYVDTIKYILDINTGSQWQIDLLELGIKNAQKIVDLQTMYYRIFKDTYKDPFGYGDSKYGKWQSQHNGDSEPYTDPDGVAHKQSIIQEIKEAALGLGVFSGDWYDEFNTNGMTKYGISRIQSGLSDVRWLSSAISSSGFVIDPTEQLYFQFEDSKPYSRSKMLEFSKWPFMLPSNRDFIEQTGGIQKFGIDKQHWLWNSAFKPETINLGPAGYIDLVKDNDYYGAERTVSNRIKIYFQSDATVLASMFEDGYIADVRIPAVHQLAFWANPNIRRFMSKSNGFGTLAFEFNLDKTIGKPELQDENLRKAIAYSIDRNALAFVAGQESSFPVTTWTAFGQAKDSYGMPMETYFDKETFRAVPESESSTLSQEMPIQSYPFSMHNSKVMQFERVDRKDFGYNREMALYFLNKYKETYKAKHNGAEAPKVTLDYIYNGETVNKNIGIYLQSQLNDVLGGFVNIDIQGLPSNVFETYKTTGKYDILFYNFDSYGTEWDSYIKRFFTTDEIQVDPRDPSIDIKAEGFRNNPSGSWTYGQWFKENEAHKADLQKQLNISQEVWDKMVELSTQNSGETSYAFQSRRDTFFAKKDPNIDWQTDKKIISVIAAFEKIIRNAMPVLPLMEVDTFWEAKRIGGIDSAYFFSLQTAYDLMNKPRPNLPGPKN